MKTQNTPYIDAMLEKLRQTGRAVVSAEGRLANLRMMTTDTSVHLSGMPHADSPDQQKLETILATIDELERELAGLKALDDQLLNELNYYICQMQNHLSQRLFHKHYIEHKSSAAIADEEHFSFRYAQKVIRHGKEELDRLLETDEKRNPILCSQQIKREI